MFLEKFEIIEMHPMKLKRTSYTAEYDTGQVNFSKASRRKQAKLLTEQRLRSISHS
jgi:hypothetical protein